MENTYHDVKSHRTLIVQRNLIFVQDPEQSYRSSKTHTAAKYLLMGIIRYVSLCTFSFQNAVLAISS